MSLFRKSIKFQVENPANKYPISLGKHRNMENPRDTLSQFIADCSRVHNYTASYEIVKRTLADLP
jgi:hypothetical protein